MYKLLNYEVILASLFSMLMTSFLFGQSITGTISDADGPLIGASVVIERTSTGTVTDLDGMYSINVSAGTYTLEYSYTGYGTTS